MDWVSSQHVGLRVIRLLKLGLKVPKVSIPVHEAETAIYWMANFRSKSNFYCTVPIEADTSPVRPKGM